MFEGIVNVKLIDIVAGGVDLDITEHNSITARGLRNVLDDGRLFGEGINVNPLIHVYTHAEPISPAVWSISGYAGTCTESAPPAIVSNADQLFNSLVVTGTLAPDSVTRVFQTVGLGYTTSTDTPSFAVRLTNPITQTPTQIVQITYSIIARQMNMVSSDSEMTGVHKVTNNVWDEYFKQLVNQVSVPTPVLNNTLAFVDAPDNFTTSSNLSGHNSLAEMVGVTNANQAYVPVPSTPLNITIHKDEATVVLEQTFQPTEAVGVNFNKSLAITNSGVNMYLNDVGFSNTTPQLTTYNAFTHTAGSHKPYANVTETFATSVGSAFFTSPPTTQIRSPMVVRVTYTSSGSTGTSEYFLSTRYTWGFTDNDAGLERAYRLPALPRRDSSGAWITTTSTSIAYVGTPIASFTPDAMETFSLVLSQTPGSNIIDGTTVDAICVPSSNALTVISNLGTTITKINSTTYPTFSASSLTSYATVSIGTRTRLFTACSSTGLWRVDELSSDGSAYIPSTPFVVAVPYVNTSACYAVDARNLAGDPTVVAVFDGGVAISYTSGTSWDVFNNSSTPGTYSFSYTGITDNNWSNVRAVLLGPADVGTHQAVVGLVRSDDIVWVELSTSGAVVTGVTPITGIHTGPFLTQKYCKYFPTPNTTTIPSSFAWMVFNGTTLSSVPYTQGSGPSSVVAAPTSMTTTLIRSRFFESTTASGTTVGMVLYDTSAGTNGAVVLVDASFNVIATQDHLLGRTLNADELSRLSYAMCRPYRHFYLTSRPQFELFNAFATSELYSTDTPTNTLHHIYWRDYEYLGSEWVAVDASLIPLTTANYGSVSTHPTHNTPEVVNSTSPGGITRDIPTGTTLVFVPDADSNFNCTANEFATCTLTTGIQKDAYMTLSHRVSHTYHRSTMKQNLQFVGMNSSDFVDRPLGFITRDAEDVWTSHLGTLGASDVSGDQYTRSELTTPGVDQDFSIAFKVTAANSTGSLSIGVATDQLAVTPSGTVDDNIPVRIEFTGQTYEVIRAGSSVAGPSPFGTANEFTLTISAGTFSLKVGGVDVTVTDNTLPSSLVGHRLSIGVYALSNQNRYIYDARTISWPVSSMSGVALYKLTDGGVDFAIDPLAITFESRTETPPTFVIDGGSSVELITDPRIVLGDLGATNQIKLLPKTRCVVANNVSDIGVITASALLYHG